MIAYLFLLPLQYDTLLWKVYFIINNITPSVQIDPPNKALYAYKTTRDNVNAILIFIICLNHTQQGLMCHKCLPYIKTTYGLAYLIANNIIDIVH